MLRLAHKLNLRIAVHPREIDMAADVDVDGPWSVRVGPPKGREIHLINWTVQGDGLHFDAWRPGQGQRPEQGIQNRKERSKGPQGRAESERDKAAPDGAKAGGARRQGTRVFCPVPGCAKGQGLGTSGWENIASMSVHLALHTTGILQGVPPEDWRKKWNKDTCCVCSRVISKRTGGTCPRCRPAQRMGETAETKEGRQLLEGTPGWREIATGGIVTRGYVPQGCRQLWGHCLSAQLEDVAKLMTKGRGWNFTEWHRRASRQPPVEARRAKIRPTGRAGKG